MNNKRTKGPMAEESLRNYFLSIGYYVVRGVKFKFRCFDVTDVDLWLYSRKTPLNRERACVDIKNKPLKEFCGQKVFRISLNWTLALSPQPIQDQKLGSSVEKTMLLFWMGNFSRD